MKFIAIKYLFFASIAWLRGFTTKWPVSKGDWNISCPVGGPIKNRIAMYELGWKPVCFQITNMGYPSRKWRSNNNQGL